MSTAFNCNFDGAGFSLILPIVRDDIRETRLWLLIARGNPSQKAKRHRWKIQWRAACFLAIVWGLSEDLCGYNFSYIAAQIKFRSTMKTSEISCKWEQKISLLILCRVQPRFCIAKACSDEQAPDWGLAVCGVNKGRLWRFFPCAEFFATFCRTESR